jgi:hypothetical protein
MGIQHRLQEPRGLFQRVGAVGDNNAAHVGVGESAGTTLCKRAPHTELHVLAVQLRNLLGDQTAT